MDENTPSDAQQFIELAGELTIAWLQNPNVNPGTQDVQGFLKDMHATIIGLDAKPLPEDEPVVYEPKVSVRSSVKPDHLISLIDGKKYKTLKRHLKLNGLTPDEYRARYGLKPDYPMVAESYAAQRREIAHKLGLGQKRAPATKAVPDKAAPDKVKAETVTAPAKKASGKPVPAAKKASAKPKAPAAKPKGDAVSPVEAAGVVSAPVDDNAGIPAPAKTKRASAQPATAKAVTSKAKTGAKAKPTAKAKPAEPVAKKPRAKKAAAGTTAQAPAGEAVVSEG